MPAKAGIQSFAEELGPRFPPSLKASADWEPNPPKPLA
jgi:hypothetical protein